MLQGIRVSQKSFFHNCVISSIFSALSLSHKRAQLKDTKISINYKDSSGDLIEVVDDSDLLLMKDDSSRSTGRSNDDSTAPWTLYITRAGDHTVYNTTMT